MYVDTCKCAYARGYLHEHFFIRTQKNHMYMFCGIKTFCNKFMKKTSVNLWLQSVDNAREAPVSNHLNLHSQT